MLEDPENGPERIGSKGWCELDFFAYWMRTRFPTVESMRGEACVLATVVLTLLIFVTSSRIECRHAWARQAVRQAQTLADTRSLLFLSSVFVIARIKTITRTLWYAEQRKQVVKKRPASASADNETGVKVKRGEVDLAGLFSTSFVVAWDRPCRMY